MKLQQKDLEITQIPLSRVSRGKMAGYAQNMVDSRSRRQEFLSGSSLKHVQPKEGRKELAPRGIKFRYRRLDTAIRERADSSQERRKRAKDTPGYFSFLAFPSFSFYS